MLMATGNNSNMTVSVLMNMNQYNQALGRMNRSSFDTANSMASAFNGVTKSLGALAVGSAIGTLIGKVGELGIQAVETENLFNVAMKEMKDEAQSFVSSLSEGLSVNETESKRQIGTLYSMTNGMGLASKEAYTLSSNFTALAYDLASFYNLPTSEAFTALRSGIGGETEPLQRLGISIKEATLQQYAYNLGIDRSITKMSEQEKMLLRYRAVMNQTSNSQTDMARTLNSPANMLRVLQQNLVSAGTQLATGFMPVISAVITPLLVFAKTLNILAGQVKAFMSGIFGTDQPQQQASVIQNVTGSVGDLSNAQGGLTKKLKKQKKEVKDNIQSFDEFHTLQKDTSDTANDLADALGGAGSNYIDPKLLEMPTYDPLKGLGVNETTEKAKVLAKSITDAFNTLSQSEIVASFSNLFNAIRTTVDTAVTNFTPSINALKTLIGTMFDAGISTITTFNNKLATFLTDNTDNFGKIEKALDSFATEGFGQLVKVVDKVKESLKNVMTEGFDRLSEFLNKNTDFFANLIKSAKDLIEKHKVIENVLGAIVKLLEVTLVFAIQTFLTNAQILIDFIKGDYNSAWETFKTMLKNSETWIANVYGQIKILSGTITQLILDITGLDKVYEKHKGIINAVAEVITIVLLPAIAKLVWALVVNLFTAFSTVYYGMASVIARMWALTIATWSNVTAFLKNVAVAWLQIGAYLVLGRSLTVIQARTILTALATGRFSTAQFILNSTVKANPFLRYATLLTVVVGALAYVVASSETVRDGLSKMAGAFVALGGYLSKGFYSVIIFIAEFLAKFYKSMLQISMDFNQKIANIMNSIVDTYNSVASTIGFTPIDIKFEVDRSAISDIEQSIQNFKNSANSLRHDMPKDSEIEKSAFDTYDNSMAVLNKFADYKNKMSGEIGSFLGFGDIGSAPDLKQIESDSKIAQAELKKQTNNTTPTEDAKQKQAEADYQATMKDFNNKQTEEKNINVTLQLDGVKLAQAVIPTLQKEQERIGTTLINSTQNPTPAGTTSN